MHSTRNDLPAGVRSRVIQVLTPLLADAIDLQSQCKQAHWTVKGSTFKSLHELFDEAAGEAEEWVDLIAERIVQLGGQPAGTVRAAAGATRLAEYPLGATSGGAHVTAVSERLAAFASHVRPSIDALAQAGDQASADLCTEIVRGADKLLWMVEAHGLGGA
jgi:starvation-inducible DNA-binding protein